MQQIVPLQCEEHKESICAICTDILCKASDRLSCFVCIKQRHVKCERSAPLARSEIVQQLENLKRMYDQPIQLINKDAFLEIKKALIDLLNNMEQQINQLQEQSQVIDKINIILQNTFTKESWYTCHKIFQYQFNNSARSKLSDITKELQEKVDSLLKLENENKIDIIHKQINNKMIRENWEIIVTNIDLQVKTTISVIACQSDGRYIACGCEDGIIRIFLPQLNRFIDELKGHSGRMTTLRYSFDNKYLASCSEDNTILIWEMDQMKQVSKFSADISIGALCFSPNGLQLALGSFDNSIRIWSVQDKQSIKCLDGHTSFIYVVVYSPDGRLLASSSDDQTIRLWDIENGLELGYQLKAYVKSLNGLRFTEDGKKLISVESNYSIKLSEVQTGKIL